MAAMKTDRTIVTSLQNGFIYKVAVKVKHWLYIRCEQKAVSLSSRVVVGIVVCLILRPGVQSPPSPGSPDPTCTQSSSSL